MASTSSFRNPPPVPSRSTVTPAVIPIDQRPALLDVTALSPEEAEEYPSWLLTIKPAPSGVASLYDEQHALLFMREKFGITWADENKILSLFERTPLGLEAGHFYALMRLVSWVQQGETPSKRLLFRQTQPAQIKGIKQTAAPVPPAPPARPYNPPAKPPPVPAKIKRTSDSVSPTNATHAHNPNLHQEGHDARIVRPSFDNRGPVRDLTATANPFRPTVGVPGGSNIKTTPIDALLGFDPAPNPFKQSKPRVVRPTPVVASANSPVPNPFKPPVNYGGDASSSVGSEGPFASPNMTSRPLPGGERAPPPLPPRVTAISPLIQAGLNARSEVRRAQRALPPKTFSVIQSTGRRSVSDQPRLLNGQSAASLIATLEESAKAQERESAASHTQPPPQHHSKRKTSLSTRGGQEARGPGMGRSVSGEGFAASATGASDRKGETFAPPPRPAKPQAVKNGVPGWLQEQEDLQRSALAAGPVDPNESLVSPSGGAGSGSATLFEGRLVDDTDVDNFSEQAFSAASIERNNPFFPPHKRDVERGFGSGPTPAAETIAKVKGTLDNDRPLGRSKTLHGKNPPLPPPRRRIESFPANSAQGAMGTGGFASVLESGTYPGLRTVKDGSSAGGLRLNPPSKKAITDLTLTEREVRERQKLDSDAPDSALDDDDQVLPPPPRRPISVKRTTTSSSGASDAHPAPHSPEEGSFASSSNATRTNSLRDRADAFLHSSENPAKSKGERPLDRIGQDVAALAERHRWLANVVESATGRPVSDSRRALVKRSGSGPGARKAILSEQGADDDATADVEYDQLDDMPAHPDLDTPPVLTPSRPRSGAGLESKISSHLSSLSRRASAPIPARTNSGNRTRTMQSVLDWGIDQDERDGAIEEEGDEDVGRGGRKGARGVGDGEDEKARRRLSRLVVSERDGAWS